MSEITDQPITSRGAARLTSFPDAIFATWVVDFLFAHLLGAKLEVNTFAFWFMMQLAMVCGLVTAYPVNWWLIRKGLKEKM